MKLVDMKNTKAEAKAEVAPSLTGPEYPWGLTITLDKASLEKLGIDELPKTGKAFVLMARVEVCSTNEYENANGSKDRSLGLQITEMSLATSSSMQDATKALYGDAK